MTDQTNAAPVAAPAPAGLDLDQVETLQTAVLHIVHPVTAKPTGATVIVAGPEHPDRKRLVHLAMRQHREEFERTGKIGMPPDEHEAQTLGLVIGCTLGWSGMSQGGQPLEFSADACKALFNDPRRAWLRDQVKAGLDQKDLFIGSSATS